jgi:hypothetical protein
MHTLHCLFPNAQEETEALTVAGCGFKGRTRAAPPGSLARRV